MRKRFFKLVLVLVVLWGIIAGKSGFLFAQESANVRVTLERVEIQSYFPWTDLPARTPLALGYVFNIENRSGSNLKLENFKFSTFFEAAPGQYLSITTPTTYDTIYFAPNTVSQYRVVDVLDSFTINLSLAVANALKMQELNLNRADLIKSWYTKIGDFAFGIKVSDGMAVFSTEKGEMFVPFEGAFPKK